MGTSRIGGNIPTDCAGTLTRRIWRIVIPRAGQSLSETDIHNAGLHNSISIAKIDLFYLFHVSYHHGCRFCLFFLFFLDLYLFSLAVQVNSCHHQQPGVHTLGGFSIKKIFNLPKLLLTCTVYSILLKYFPFLCNENSNSVAFQLFTSMIN